MASDKKATLIDIFGTIFFIICGLVLIALSIKYEIKFLLLIGIAIIVLGFLPTTEYLAEKTNNLIKWLRGERITGLLISGMEIVSQDPSKAPQNCPECNSKMEDRDIGNDNTVMHRIRVCPAHSLRGWNISYLI